MMKIGQNNDMTDSTSVVYTKIGIELSWPIKKNVIYHEKQIRQRHDWSYKCDLCSIQY